MIDKNNWKKQALAIAGMMILGCVPAVIGGRRNWYIFFAEMGMRLFRSDWSFGIFADRIRWIWRQKRM